MIKKIYKTEKDGIWIATFSDYEELENLYNVEDVEGLLYEASKKFSW